MDTIYRCCAGLDVHQKTVEATVRRLDEAGRLTTQTRRFGTMTRELLALGDWMAQEGVTIVVMEATGVYWKPVWNLLEGRFELLLVNARHVKQVPGRKTDASDSQWLAQLLQYGLLRGSLVPPRAVRELRDLTRDRTQLVQESARVANRIQKVLEDANVKLASVATDVLGVSGRAMLEAMIAGEQDPVRLAGLARGILRKKDAQLRLALHGGLTDHHRFMLGVHMEHLHDLERYIATIEERIDQKVAEQGWGQAVERLDQIPGVDKRTAQVMLCETGGDMSRFASEHHLASWAGMCPGNHESAGKRKSGKTRKGSRWLRAALVQAGWAATRTKNRYLKAQFHRLARRRGRKRALVAVGHSVLIAAYHMLKEGRDYHELGGDYFERRDAERIKRSLVRRLEALGNRVTLEPVGAPA